MGDRDGGPPELIIRRIETDIKRMELSIAQQELELMELDDRKRRVQENIEATLVSIEKRKQDLELTIQKHSEVENDG